MRKWLRADFATLSQSPEIKKPHQNTLSMDKYALSLETYGIIIKGGEISNFLKRDLENLVTECTSEEGYLLDAYAMITEIKRNQQAYLDNWLIDQRFDNVKLSAVLWYIKSIQDIPTAHRTFFECGSVE